MNALPDAGKRGYWRDTVGTSAADGTIGDVRSGVRVLLIVRDPLFKARGWFSCGADGCTVACPLRGAK